MEEDAGAARPQELGRLARVTYGCGHVFNSLCATMWFGGLLLFTQHVLKFDKKTSGILMLVGESSL